MTLLGALSKGSILKAAKKQVEQARQSEAGKAEQLYKSAYQGFAKVIAGDLKRADALYYWGLALLHEAKTKNVEQAKNLYHDAIDKFSFCLLSAPNHLGAAIDGGVAYMHLAQINNVTAMDQLYQKAECFFERAGKIQRGSAAYNLACIYALRGNKEACLQALELSKECGSMPDENDVMNDADMASVKNEQWFQEFLGTVAVERVVSAENDRRSRRGLKNVEQIKLTLPPRPTDSMLRRHYDTMVAAEIEKQRELEKQRKLEQQEKKARKKADQFDYYK